jgi:putative hydrolase of the HAD superfamily
MQAASVPIIRVPPPGSPVDTEIFDIDGTLLETETEEWGRTTVLQISRCLSYHGIPCSTSDLVDLVRGGVKRQIEASPEQYPEFGAIAVWRDAIASLTGAVRPDGIRQGHTPARAQPIMADSSMALQIAQLQRALSRRRLRPYPEVEGVLEALRPTNRLTSVSDAQKVRARYDLVEPGLTNYFYAIVVSGELGFRRPDPRIFHRCVNGGWDYS